MFTDITLSLEESTDPIPGSLQQRALSIPRVTPRFYLDWVTIASAHPYKDPTALLLRRKARSIWISSPLRPQTFAFATNKLIFVAFGIFFKGQIAERRGQACMVSLGETLHLPPYPVRGLLPWFTWEKCDPSLIPIRTGCLLFLLVRFPCTWKAKQ